MSTFGESDGFLSAFVQPYKSTQAMLSWILEKSHLKSFQCFTSFGFLFGCLVGFFFYCIFFFKKFLMSCEKKRNLQNLWKGHYFTVVKQWLDWKHFLCPFHYNTEEIRVMIKEILATISDEFSMKISDCYCDKNDEGAVIMELTWGIISSDPLPDLHI